MAEGFDLQMEDIPHGRPDDDYDDKDEEETSFIDNMDDEQFQKALKIQYEAMEHLEGQDKTDYYQKILKMDPFSRLKKKNST